MGSLIIVINDDKALCFIVTTRTDIQINSELYVQNKLYNCYHTSFTTHLHSSMGPQISSKQLADFPEISSMFNKD